MSAGRTLIRDRGSRWSGLSAQRDQHRPFAARKRHLVEVHSCCGLEAGPDTAGANADRQGLCLLESRDHIDAVTDTLLGGTGTRNTIRGAAGATIGTDALGGGTVPEAGTLGVDCNASRSCFKRLDVVGENPSPAVVGVGGIDIDFGSGLGDTLAPDWADIV